MKKIYVTESFLPPLEEYEQYLKQIWESYQLTNQGPLLKRFEDETKAYLGVNDMHFVTNGTVALQVALRALDITEGEIITTPFSYVATISSILWERCKPVFVDIEPNTFCIDASKIEAAITDKTKAIMPVHVYGFVCDVDLITEIAKKHNIKVIYDAAHAFGVKYKDKSILSYGDISMCSFHATKLFHTIEGGAIVANDRSLSDKVELIKRFGHQGDEHHMLGINAKASEFQAAMGLSNLKYIDGLIKKRKHVFELYNQLLTESFKIPSPQEGVTPNYSYYPFVFKDEATLQKTLVALQEQNIFPRRYFYPSLNTLPYIGNMQSCPISEDIARRIVCLPLYPGLEDTDVRRICDIIKEIAP